MIAAFLAAYAVAAFAAVALLGSYVRARPPAPVDLVAANVRGRAVPLAAFFTTLGYWPALTALGAAVILIPLGGAERLGLRIALVVSHTLAQGAIVALKRVFGRKRPANQLVNREPDASYPSGHAATAVTFFVASIVFVWYARTSPALALPLTLTCACCAIGIPWSRIALGAHYLTDVLAGLLFGSAWLAGSLAICLRYFHAS